MASAVNTVVIGGGPAGLTLSMILLEKGVSHVVLEKNARPFEAWRSQRWDGFLMNTPHAGNRLHGQEDQLPHDAVGLPVASVVAAWDAHLARTQPPLRLRHQVTRVAKADDGDDLIVTWRSHDGRNGMLRARNVVAAPGYLQIPKVPACATRFPPHVMQFDGTTFKNAGQLNPGSVLIVGAGQTGVQLADHLLRQGRNVYLCTSRAAGLPRTFRGMDIVQAMIETGIATVTKGMVGEKERYTIPVRMVGADRAISYHSLARLGCCLVGRLEDIEEGSQRLVLRDDLATNIEHAQKTYEATLADLTSRSNGLEAFNGRPPPKREPEFEPYEPLLAYANDAPRELDIERCGITNVIWATGFSARFPWLAIDEVRKAYAGRAFPNDCATPHPGFFWLGFAFARNRLSDFLVGQHADALWISQRLR